MTLPAKSERSEGVETLQWLRALVAEEMAECATLGLARMPIGSWPRRLPDGRIEQRDVMERTILNWVRAIAGHFRELEPADAPRLRAAFAEMRSNIRAWPAPAELFDYVEARAVHADTRSAEEIIADMQARERQRQAANEQPPAAPAQYTRKRLSKEEFTARLRAEAQRIKPRDDLPGPEDGRGRANWVRRRWGQAELTEAEWAAQQAAREGEG